MGERLVCIQKVAGSTPVCSTILSGYRITVITRRCQRLDDGSIPSTRSRLVMDELEKQITHVIMQILLEARRRGLEMLSYEEVLELLGFDDKSLLTDFEKDSYLSLNTELLDKLEDPELIQAMVESLGETKH